MQTHSPQFGFLLKSYRERAGLTLRGLAELGPFSYSHLSRMETGSRNPPSREDVIAVAKALDADVDSLLTAAGYLPEGEQALPLMEVDKTLFTNTAYAPTSEELRLINLANLERIFFGLVTDAGFWNNPPSERRAAFRYLEGMIDEARRFKQRAGSTGKKA